MRSADNGAQRSALRLADAVSVGTFGLRHRRARSVLTALGIAIGIASIVAVMGISASSRADLLAQLDALGTDLLVVEAGTSLTGETVRLSPESVGMVTRIGPVRTAAAVARLDTTVLRTELETRDVGLSVLASEPSLLETIGGTMRRGAFLRERSDTLPVVVLGAVAAQRLGLTELDGAPTVRIAGTRFAVSGVLDELPLHPDLDRAVIIGENAARSHLGADVFPTRVYVRTIPQQVTAVGDVLPRTVSPGSPEQVKVSRPSDALAARAHVDQNLRNLLLGLGGVALLVGGIGIANVMIISVLERRTEIGLRRALGARRRHIAAQFVLESASLASLGGVTGAALGALATSAYATRQGWIVAIPGLALVGAVGAALLLGALAGLYPAGRAARLDPADALRPAG